VGKNFYLDPDGPRATPGPVADYLGVILNFIYQNLWDQQEIVGLAE
jgi:hypothetical protein